jgi:hypothetical protein
MPDVDDIWDDEEDIRTLWQSQYQLEATRPVDKLPPIGQQLAAAWQAEHGDEPYPT